MNLPFIVDVAIGLVLIYLILSLLSSEIQEILATILQWRAAHLKKSIEILLLGDGDQREKTPDQIAQAVADALPDWYEPAQKQEIKQTIQTQLQRTEPAATTTGSFAPHHDTAVAKAKAIASLLNKRGLLEDKPGTAAAKTAANVKLLIEKQLTDALVLDELYKARKITQTIYDNPLIRNISQNARGGFEGLIRTATRSLITVGRRNTTLARGNEPSYIPSETFATTLLEILDIPQFTRRLTALNLQILVQDQIVSDIEEAVEKYKSQGRSPQLNQLIDTGFDKFNAKLHLVLKAFVDQRISLEMSISLIRGELVEYVTKAEAIRKKLTASQETNRARSFTDEDIEAFDGFVNQLISTRQLVFYEDPQGKYQNTNELIQQLQPSVAQVMKAFRSDLQDVNQKYRRFAEAESLGDNANIKSGYAEIRQLYNEIRQDAQQIAQKLPGTVRASLDVLAARAQINVAHTESTVRHAQDDLYQFKTEIENWFDRSMERAAGVYKRNAKGVGFLIGLTIALVINADTVHIAQRLSSSSTLRQALVSSADTVTQSCPRPPIGTIAAPAASPTLSPGSVAPAPAVSPAPTAPPVPTSSLGQEQTATAQSAPVLATAGESLNCIEQAVENVTDLPLGWGEKNVLQQMTIKPIDSNGDGQAEKPAPWVPLWYHLKRAIGWIVSGLALSMGAAFWFELLSKLINVRNTGKRPNDRVAT
ncbi:hypothetical protein IFO70_37800 [Phormidium tenue FACHB-886]|nr:hypothetical protein [Phormidium tenue FACHB-886]